MAEEIEIEVYCKGCGRTYIHHMIRQLQYEEEADCIYEVVVSDKMRRSVFACKYCNHKHQNFKTL